jgi:hypothetical protein
MLAPSSLHVCLGRQASPFLLTAGMDRQIRYWDLRKPAASFCASGYAMETGPTNQLGRPSFVAQQIMPAANMTMPADGVGGGGGLIKGSGIPCQVFLCQDPAMPGMCAQARRMVRVQARCMVCVQAEVHVADYSLERLTNTCTLSLTRSHTLPHALTRSHTLSLS